MKTKKIISAFLALAMVLSMPLYAFADVTKTVSAGFYEGMEQHVTVNGDVSVVNETNAVFVEAHAPEAYEDKNASAEVKGNVTAESDTDFSAVYVEGRNGDAYAKITGSLVATVLSNANVNGVETWGHSYNGTGYAYADIGSISVTTNGSATGIDNDCGDVSVTNDVTAAGADATGVESYYEGNVYISGSLKATGTNSACGAYLYASEGKEQNLTVENDVDVTCNSDSVYSEADALRFFADSGKTIADIKGNVIASSDVGTAGGLRFFGSYSSGNSEFSCLSSASFDVKVGKSIISDGYGIAKCNDAGTADVFVENEIQAKKTAVLLWDDTSLYEEVTDGSAYSENQLNLTAWKLNVNERGNVAELITENSSEATPARNFEKKINYIIKAQQPTEGGTVSLVDENGSPLKKVNNCFVANEGDKIIVKPNLEDGYRLKAAYNGVGEKLPLLKDENGDFYIIVPKGGGINISTLIEKVPVIDTDSISVTLPEGKTKVITGDKVQFAVAISDDIGVAGASVSFCNKESESEKTENLSYNSESGLWECEITVTENDAAGNWYLWAVTACDGDDNYTYLYNSEVNSAYEPNMNLNAYMFTVGESCKVTFDSLGGTEIAPVYVEKGKYATEPERPEKEGYVFSYWHQEGSNYQSFSFKYDAVNTDITLTAHWGVTLSITTWDKTTMTERVGGLFSNYEDYEGYRGCNNYYYYSTEEKMNLYARPDVGYKFVGWYKGLFNGVSGQNAEPLDLNNPENLVSAEKNIVYALDKNSVLVAVFEECTEHDWVQIIEKGSPEKDGKIYQVCSICNQKELVATFPKADIYTFAPSECTYTGKACEPKLTVARAGEALAENQYDIKYSNNINVGTATALVTFKGDYYEGTKTLTFKINKAKNTLFAKGKTIKLKALKLKKSGKKIKRSKAITIKNAKGKISYKKVKGNKKITVNKKTGKITVKKGIKKGTYKIRVNVTANGNNNYNKAVKKAVIKIVVE